MAVYLCQMWILAAYLAGLFVLCQSILAAGQHEHEHEHDRALLVDNKYVNMGAPSKGASKTLVLVTGAAGFIGSNFMINLHDNKIAAVGLDNFDVYYSVILKRRRAQRVMQNTGYKILDGDICDANMLSELFANNEFTHIVNLAAR